MTCVYRRSSLRLTATGMDVLYTELTEGIRMFRLAVDICDVRRNRIEPDRSLWKLLPMYRMEWNIREGTGKKRDW